MNLSGFIKLNQIDNCPSSFCFLLKLFADNFDNILITLMVNVSNIKKKY